MTATLLSPESTVVRDLPVQREGSEIRRPPTLFGKESPWDLVVTGHAAARRAIGLALEQVGLDDAADALCRAYGRDELRMAFHFLAWTRFDVPLQDQVNALFLVEDALNALDRAQDRGRVPSLVAPVAQGLRRLWDRFRDWLASRSASSATPRGLAPAC